MDMHHPCQRKSGNQFLDQQLCQGLQGLQGLQDGLQPESLADGNWLVKQNQLVSKIEIKLCQTLRYHRNLFHCVKCCAKFPDHCVGTLRNLFLVFNCVRHCTNHFLSTVSDTAQLFPVLLCQTMRDQFLFHCVKFCATTYCSTVSNTARSISVPLCRNTAQLISKL
jgi:hypothetical protein